MFSVVSIRSSQSFCPKGHVTITHDALDVTIQGPRPPSPPHNGRVATAQGKQGIWFLLFPDRENTGNFALTQGKILRHRENIFL